MCDYRRWELDSVLRSSHKTGKHALEVSAVSSKKESLPGKINEYGSAHFVLRCTRSSLSAYCPLSYNNQCADYCEVLRTLKRHVNKKRPDLKKIWLCRYDNTKPHTASIVREFLEKGKIEVLMHPVYGPDLAPCNSSVFGTLKRELHNRHLKSDFELVTHKPLLLRPSSRRIPQNNDCKIEGENASMYCE